jgi:hypothetical protein
MTEPRRSSLFPRVQGCVAAVIAALALALPSLLLAAGIDRVSPENWWVGMRSPALQLMVQGEGIGASTPSLDHPGVHLARVTRVDSPNYLFLDLHIDPAAQPGELQIRFEGKGGSHTLAYPLLAREPGSAQRRGFGPQDVILNLMPDRFANADPGNDSVEGYADRADRDAPSGRHGGDLAGMARHLDYIAGMGFTMVWPTPLMENNQPQHSYHGYAVTDLYRVDPRFGSNEDYRRFVQQARERGIGVIQDLSLIHI